MFTHNSGREHIQLLLKVARLYYEDGLSQNEIAKQIRYSRPTVSRMLSEAKEQGIVQFSIFHPLETALEQEEKLRSHFGLADVSVVISEQTNPSQQVGRAAAQMIIDHGNSSSIVAMSNGTSVAAVVDAMPPQKWPLSCVTQLMGSFTTAENQLLDAQELCRRMSLLLGGIYHTLPMPIVMGTASAAASVKREEVTLTMLELAARSDIALTGVGVVGDTTASSAVLRPFITPSIERELRQQGAVGHICGHHVDAHGNHIRTSLCDRLIAIEPERLKEVKLSIAVAWGAAKVPAIHAVLKSGFVNALVTDERTARMVLRYSP